MPNNVSKLRGANAGQQSEVAQHTRGHCSLTLKPGQVTLDFSSQTGTGCQLTYLPPLPEAGPSLGSPLSGLCSPNPLPPLGQVSKAGVGIPEGSWMDAKPSLLFSPGPTALGGADMVGRATLPEHMLSWGVGPAQAP